MTKKWGTLRWAEAGWRVGRLWYCSLYCVCLMPLWSSAASMQIFSGNGQRVNIFGFSGHIICNKSLLHNYSTLSLLHKSRKLGKLSAIGEESMWLQQKSHAEIKFSNLNIGTGNTHTKCQYVCMGKGVVFQNTDNVLEMGHNTGKIQNLWSEGSYDNFLAYATFSLPILVFVLYLLCQCTWLRTKISPI